MESEIIRLKVSPEFLSTIIHQETYSGQTFGVYSGMTQMLSGGTGGSSLFTDLTVPILLKQNTVNIGYFSVFDGAINQINAVNNFIFSATTANPFQYYFYNTSDVEYKAFLDLASYTVDWGDGSPIQTVSSFTPNFVSHDYPPTPAWYDIILTQNAPWGTNTVKKKIYVPYSLQTIFNSQGTAYFTPNVGNWTATPISYNYIFTGDSENNIQSQISSNSVTVPFVVSGVTTSRLRELQRYGKNAYPLLVPVQKDGEDWGIITDKTGYDPDIQLAYTAYTIQNINYLDYSDGSTIYAVQSSGLTEDWLVAEPIVKDERLLGSISEPEIQSTVFIERGKQAAMEKIQRLGEVDNLGDLVRYGYGYFKVEKI
jgi:hypothetical protein